MSCDSAAFNQGLKATEIDLENLTPFQRRLQLKFLACRQHNGGCRCFLTGQNPRPVCKREKKLSRSFVKEREPKKPIIETPNCEVRANKCCDLCPKKEISSHESTLE